MKLSEFKEYIINKYGEEAWEDYESTYGYSIYSSNKEEQLEAVRKYGCNIKYIQNPSEEVQLEAVKESGEAIKYINNPSEDLQLEAVKENGFNLLYINNPTDKVIQEAVKGINCSFDSGYLLRHLENDLKGKK